MLDPAYDYELAHAVKIAFPPDEHGRARTYLRWTGRGNLTLGADTYTAGGIVSVSEIETASESESRVTVVLDASTAYLRGLFLGTDPGPVESSLRTIWRKRPKSGGAWTGWTLLALAAGKLGSIEFSDAASTATVEIQRVYDDIWRGEIVRWTGAEQRRRHPGDSGLDRSDRARRSGLLVGWQA